MSDESVSHEAALEAAVAAANEAAPPAEQDAAPEVSAPSPDGQGQEAEAPKSPMEAYQEKLQRIMEEQRQKYEQTSQQRQQQQYDELIRKSLERQAAEPPRQPSLADLFKNQDDDDKPDYVKKLEQEFGSTKKELEELKAYRQQLEEQAKINQRLQWEHNEQRAIQQFIDQSAEEFEYVAALKPMRSDADIYNGMISMYQQGMQPTHKDMAELVETRVEGVLDHLAGTKKFAKWLEKRFGFKAPQQQLDSPHSPTLTSRDSAESPSPIDPSNLTEEESIALALKAAKEAAERASQR